MNEHRNVEAEELELLHDITRFLLRRAQSLHTKYTVQDIAALPMGEVTLEPAAEAVEQPEAEAQPRRSEPDPLPENCPDCGKELTALTTCSLFVGGKAIHLCRECYDERDRPKAAPEERKVCGLCNEELSGDDLSTYRMNPQYRQKRRVMELNKEGEEQLRIEWVIACKACYEKEPEREITVEARDSSLPAREEVEATTDS